MIVLALTLLAALSGVLASVALMIAGKPLPWAEQTWDGESENEKAFRKRGENWQRAGLVLLGLAFVLSAASALVDYFGD